MKKAIYCGAILCGMLLLAACSPSTPGKALVKYCEYVEQGEFEKFVDGIAFEGDEDPAQVAANKAQLASVLKEKSEESLKERSGVKEFEVVSESFSEDGKAATVRLKTVYGNGEIEESDNAMILQDGVWKMKLVK